MIIKAIILGIIEGLTEFLPVSSTGHLIIANKFIKFTGSFANAFDVVIQVGAILAVIIYFKDKLFPKFGHGKQSGKVYRLWGKVVVGFLPAMVLGFLLNDFLEEHLFYPRPVAMALIVGALLLLYAENRLKRVRVHDTDEISYKDAFIIGFIQCLAMWPGMSRSASTIIGGLLIGLSREVAAEFSFFLAIPTLIGAAALM
ncbi:MAG: undecaprenyl-diphosphate phosphatase, partial [Caloramator sp.]|nr:undecaprenyl-diphosphate phosphatase [Caloramator sp.]